MPRQSYREHRAARTRAAAAYGSDADLESIASFSTLASHTTLASVAGRPLSPHYGYAHGQYPGLDSAASSIILGTVGETGSVHGSQGSLGPAWSASAAHQRAPSISLSVNNMSPNSSPAPSPLLTGAGAPPGSSAQGSASGSPRTHHNGALPPSPTASVPSPRPHISHRTSSSGSLPMGASAGTSGSAHLVPAVTRLRKESHSRTRDREKSSKDRTDRDRERERAAASDEKRRKKERNAERWRRVRAREAAHDAPVRRWAKAAYARYGATGAMVAAIIFALALRVLLTLVALYISPRVRTTLDKQVRSARAACSLPPLKTIAPLCAATIGQIDAPVTTKSAMAVIAGHLALEGMLGWGAAVAWAVIEGWREGRTVRTRVAAVVYLVLAPVLVLSDGALLQMRTAPLGLMAWAILAAVSGHDGAAAATIAAACWAERGMRVYAPAFAVYAVGKRIWLGPKGRGYIARLVMSALMVLTVLVSLQPVPLRARVVDAIGSVQDCIRPAALFGCVKTVLSAITLRGVLSFVALIPSAYLMIRASYVLRPGVNEPYTSQSVPATARLLPMMFTAVAAAIAVPYGDAPLPLLPLSLASSLRGDDDEWAVSVQTHHVAVMCLWPAFGSLIPLAAAVTLAWDWLIGARTDAPNAALRAHQRATKLVIKLGLVPWPRLAGLLIPRLPAALAAAVDGATLIKHIMTAHRAFTVASIAMLVVWTNIRLVKSAWAVGAL